MPETVEKKAMVNIIAGSTGAGKTTFSLAMAKKIGGMRFSIDEWMGDLFWMDSPQPIQYEWTMDRIARCEHLIFKTVERLAGLGIPSILDLGFTRADHRQKFAALAQDAGLSLRLYWLDIPAAERWERVKRRNADKGETYNMDVNEDMFQFMEDIWEEPSADEMTAMDGERCSA